MKNIHVLPTDKPSRLFDFMTKLMLVDKISSDEGNMNRHIFITNSDKIKEGDWIYYTSAIGYCKTTVGSKGLEQEGIPAKKIILTTDQDLIADGVQAIDDEFLEWFVHNPSCEWVEVKKGKMKLNDDGEEYGFPDMSLYKIIIPNEPKQETLEETALRLYPKIITDSYNPSEDLNKYERDIFIEGAQWQQEQDKKLYSEEEVNKKRIIFIYGNNR